MNQNLKLISYYAQTKKNSDWLLRCWLGFFFTLPIILHKAEYANLWRISELKKARARYMGSFIKYVHKILQKTNISYPLMRIRGARNVSFTENFAYGLNEWSLLLSDKYCDILTILWFQAIVPGVQKPPNWFLVQTRWQVSSWWKHWSLMWYCHIYIAST